MIDTLYEHDIMNICEEKKICISGLISLFIVFVIYLRISMRVGISQRMNDVRI